MEAFEQKNAPTEGRSRFMYVDTFPALIDKYVKHLLSGHSIPPFAAFIVAACIFLQDNHQGHLRTPQDVLWTFAKCLCFVALYGAYRVASRFLRAHSKPKEPAIVQDTNATLTEE